MPDPRRSYDAVAERYAAEVGAELADKPLDRGLLDAFAALVGPGPVLDTGCGPGHVAAYLARRGLDVSCLDLSASMCAVARRTTSRPAVVGDLTRLPVASAALAGAVSLYAVIHLDPARRATAYAELARVLRPGGHLLVGFHVSDADAAAGTERTVTDWWATAVDLTFWFLDPDAEARALALAGLEVTARLDRSPHPGTEHQSRRCYLLARRA